MEIVYIQGIMKNKPTKPKTRLYAPPAGEAILYLDDADTLAVRRTLRLIQGETVACFNGDGLEYLYAIDNSKPDSLSLSLVDQFENPCDQLPPCCVLTAATKGKTKDRIIRDLTPLGITQLIIYHAQRSVCRMEAKQTERLQKIAIEACRQCGRSTIPTIEVFEQNFMNSLEKNHFPFQQTLVFWEHSKQNSTLDQFTVNSIQTLIFGPEGGFSPGEVDYIRKSGLQTASLGQRILRSELAAVVGVSLLQYRKGLLS